MIRKIYRRYVINEYKVINCNFFHRNIKNYDLTIFLSLIIYILVISSIQIKTKQFYSILQFHSRN